MRCEAERTALFFSAGRTELDGVGEAESPPGEAHVTGGRAAGRRAEATTSPARLRCGRRGRRRHDAAICRRTCNGERQWPTSNHMMVPSPELELSLPVLSLSLSLCLCLCLCSRTVSARTAGRPSASPLDAHLPVFLLSSSPYQGPVAACAVGGTFAPARLGGLERAAAGCAAAMRAAETASSPPRAAAAAPVSAVPQGCARRFI
ncbi:hypothetical protein CDD83_1403 [Cordyceps sp. RAO-2017]|nr:hypothetical protein CDD83_1403 [Cordyceps sp. RAO-2017]